MTIEFELSKKSIENAIHRVELYNKDLKKKTEILVDRLAEDVKSNAEKELLNNIGVDEYVEETFDSLAIKKTGIYTRNVLASGGAVWLEFGTGVVANNCNIGDYPHPLGELFVDGIGTYGKGRGGSPYGWWYYDDAHQKHHTYGIPATMFLWKSTVSTSEKITSIARGLYHT